MERRHLILFIGVFVAAISGILIKLSDSDPFVIATYRMGYASLMMLAISVHKGVLSKFLSMSRTGKSLIVLSGFFLGAHFATWTASLSYTTITVSTVIVDSSPLFVLFLSYKFLDERIDRHGAYGLAMILMGAVAIVYNEISLDIPLLGAFLALLGSVTLASYLVIGRKVRDGIDTLSYVTLIYVFAFLFLLLASAVRGTSLGVMVPREQLLFALLAIGPSCIGHTVYNYSLRHFKAAQVSASILFEPIGASILAVFILGEIPTMPILIGAALIISGLFLVMELK